MRRKLLYLLVIATLLAVTAVLLLPGGGTGRTVEYTGAATAATYVSADAPTTNYRDAKVLSASRVSYRALLQFTTTIPAGSTFDSATVVLHPADMAGGVFEVYRAGSFDPTTVTWNDRPSTGSSPVGSSSASTGGAAQTIALTGLDLGGVVNLAVGYSQPGFIAKLFGMPDHAPVLHVVYTPPAGATTTTQAGGATPTTAGAAATTTTTASVPPSGTPHAAANGHKVLVIVEENHSQSEALASMPYLASMAGQYGQATHYVAVTHPSLPNYLAIFGGDTFGVSSDCDVGSSGCVPPPGSVWDQTIAAGETAKAYQESMATNCQTGSAGAYVARHSPWPYWTDPTGRANCNANDVPLGTTTSGNLLDDVRAGHLPVTGEITPNLDHDAHNGSLSQADSWLRNWLPVVMAGPDYRSGQLTIVVTFDEDDSSQGNTVPFVVVDPRLGHVTVTGTFDHYSLTRWLDDNAGVARLRNAASAPDLRAAFGLG